MVAQGVLGFQYESDSSHAGLTSLAGLPLYLDLIHASGLGTAIRPHMRVAGTQGWLDIQMVLAVIFLNLAGGDCVEDLERLETDSGFAAILQRDRAGFAVTCRAAFAEGPLAAGPRTRGAFAVGVVGLAGAIPRSGGAESGRG